jgi:beta-glucosidase-like glycosyl hydrolase
MRWEKLRSQNPKRKPVCSNSSLVWTGTPTISGWPGCTTERARTEILTPENRKAARKIAEQSLVLLKNDRQILPSKKTVAITLIGPLANDPVDLLGSWHAGDWRQGGQRADWNQHCGRFRHDRPARQRLKPRWRRKILQQSG